MHRRCWPAYKRLLQSTSWPILVGPWHSELGFEALYWIPFVQALGIDPARLIPITRGGAGVWYGASRGMELYGLRTPKEVRIENLVQQHATGLLKQVRRTAFDNAILKDTAAAFGLKRYHVLHPAWMYQLLAPFWEGRHGIGWVYRHLLHTERAADGTPQQIMRTIAPPALPDGVKLPDAFVAARFYLRPTFPYSEQTVTVARETLKALAAQAPVILLDSDIHADDHVDVPLKPMPNVIRLTDLCAVTPENNLAALSAVLGRAKGFVGTYGGLAQLALRMGKPTVSFYQSWHSTALAHKHLADALATTMGLAASVVKMGDVPLLRAVLPPLAYQGAGQQGSGVRTQVEASAASPC